MLKESLCSLKDLSPLQHSKLPEDKEHMILFFVGFSHSAEHRRVIQSIFVGVAFQDGSWRKYSPFAGNISWVN